jgi:hypothetical protein
MSFDKKIKQLKTEIEKAKKLTKRLQELEKETDRIIKKTK